MKKESLFELKERIRRLELKEAEKKRQEEDRKINKFEESTGIHIYTSDDYCGLELPFIHFYYGYEETYCKKHGKNKDCEDRDCEKNEWAFTVTIRKKEVMRIPKSKLHPEKEGQPFWYLIAGIGHYLKAINLKDIYKIIRKAYKGNN